MLLSKNEDWAYRELKKQGFIVFKIKNLRLLLDIDSTKAYNLVKSLKRKKVIRKINGFFAFTDVDDFVLGANIHYPVYVSFWSALSYYGWSDQTPRTIFFATTKYKKNIGSFRYITLSKKRFFGYVNMERFAIAEKEKALIDSLLFPKYSGGMREIKICLEASFREINKEKLMTYALKLGSKAVVRRLGFLLESLQYKKFHKLIKHIGRGYERLDPSLKRKNKLDKKWLLDLNW